MDCASTGEGFVVRTISAPPETRTAKPPPAESTELIMAARSDEEERIARAFTRMGPYGYLTRGRIPELSEDSQDPITMEILADGLEALAENIVVGMADDKRNEDELSEFKTIARSFKRFVEIIEEVEP
jgi:hypothetical protein